MNQKENFFGDVKKHLMSGVSFMLPVIIIYAFFMILGQLPGEFGILCAELSTAGQTLISIVLAAYIVKAIVLLAGKFKQGQLNDILTSFIIVPVIATLVGGAIIYFLIGNPITSALETVYTWLETMSTGSSILLALILGGMIAFDMGGPVNKVAYTFAIAASTEGLYHVVAPVLIAITIPVLSVGLITILFKKKYTDDERVTGKTALFMSIFGLTEGAIPFAVVNPFRVIPAFMVGSMTGAALAAILGVVNTSVVPSLLGLAMGFTTIGNAVLFILCHIVGVAVCIAMLLLLKEKQEPEEATA